MAQNVTIMGASYSDVPAVTLPKTGGGTARFTDVTPTTATDSDVLSGKVYFKADGSQSTGTGSGGGGTPTLQTKSKTYTPSTSQQTEAVTYDSGYDGLDTVNITVNAMPSGSASAPSTISGTSASVSTGTNTLTLSKTVSVTPTVSAGYVSSGTATNSSVSLTASVTTKGATNHYATTSDQTIASGTYLTGTQTIKALSQTNLTAENIKSGTTITINNGNANVWSVLGTYSGGGGTDHLTKIATKSLGTISTSSTSASDTGQTLAVSGFDAYNMLIAICYTPTHTNGRHVATVRLINFSATSSTATKTGTSIATSTQHYKLSSSGTLTQRSGTTAYGVYVNGATINTSTPRTLTLTIYQRYNSTSSGTINGSYTLDVYGVKLQDLF